MDTFDVAVMGLGAIGSASVYQLARRNVRVLGIDRYASPHTLGSTHGGTRITREAIGEGTHLTPLARRSHQIWREIEQKTAVPLLSTCGLLVISSTTRTSFTHVEGFFANTVAAARTYGVAHEILNSDAIRVRYPQFRVGDDEVGYFEPGGGFVRPESCVAAQLSLARQHGADIRLNERVRAFVPGPKDVLITTNKDSYRANALIVAAGAWLPEFLDNQLAEAFRVFRQVMFWFAPVDNSFRPERFPAFIWELSGRTQAIYGFPDVDGDGVKVATEQYEQTTTAASVKQEVSQHEAVAVHKSLVAPFLPQLTAHCLRAVPCLYTVTRDFGFVIDRHPQSDRVILASCCSGHGFKHSAALGEVLAELALTGHSTMDLKPFRLGRLLRD
ncbi:MAG TPA: N-methyl-L-tryptophan oxidase [Rhizomicrobium sp.]|jgi:sarcosine oxidase|nr:N-methyl-L-tryptophan oxidase [Rhizomicrobium sp.]